MASFVSTMHEWRRMCIAIQSENQKSPFGSFWCSNCPIEQFCRTHTRIWDSTDDIFRIVDERVQAWADKNKEPVYPTWEEWLSDKYNLAYNDDFRLAMSRERITADIAQKLGIEPKEG